MLLHMGVIFYEPGLIAAIYLPLRRTLVQLDLYSTIKPA